MGQINTGLRIALLLLLATLLFTIGGTSLQKQMALIPQPREIINAPQLPFLGINVALAQTVPADRQAALARLRSSGFGWVRLRVDWGEIEAAPGHYNWSGSDALFHEIQAAGLTPVVVLDGSPRWARAGQDQSPNDNPLAPPADFHHFAHFAAAFATRYADQLRFYQIWDEPNIAPHWGNRLIEPIGYAQLLKVTATAIRNVDRDAVIIAAALAPTRDRGHTAIDEPYFLQRLYAAGAAPYFDVVAIQPFGFGHAPQDQRARPDLLNFGRAQLVRRTMLAAGDGATPVWAVRYGWNRQAGSPWAVVNPEKQGHFATQALTLARQEWPWLTAMGWAIDQPAAPSGDPAWGFALTPGLAAALREWVAIEGGDNRTQGAPDAVVERRNRLMSVKQLFRYILPPPNLPRVQGRRASPVLAPIRQPGWEGVLPNLIFNVHQRVGAVGTLWAEGIGWLVLVVGLGWRGVYLGYKLPWAKWGARYRSWPIWLRVGIWLGLGIIYYFATWPGLILLCWLAAVILLGWQPQVGLWLAAVLLPFHAQHKEFILGGFAVAVAPSHALLLCLAVAVGLTRQRQAFRGRTANFLLLQLFRGASPERLPRLFSLALFWLLINLLSAYNVWQWGAYWEGLWDLVVMPLLAYWLVGQLIRTRQQVARLLTALFIGGGLVAVIGLAMWLQGNGTVADGVLRLVGPYFSPNGAALYLERALFVGLGLLIGANRQHRVWLIGTLLLITLALGLTASRGAWLLAIPVGLLYLGWSTGSNGWPRQPHWARRRRLIVAVILTIGLTSILLVMPYFAERMTNSASLTQRLLTWEAAAQLWQDFPMLGAGPGGFFWRYPAYLPIGALDEPNLHHPHNLWLEVATGWGVCGLLWLGLLLWQLWRQAKQQRSSSPHLAGLLAAFAAALAHAQVDALLVLPDLALWLWLGLALLTVADRDQVA